MQEKHLDGTGKLEVLYDYKYDILTFRIKDRDYSLSIEFQNFVADIDNEGFVTGVRIFDASKVFGMDKYILKDMVYSEFKARIENNAITLTIKFVGKIRNKIIPLLVEKQNFMQQITTPPVQKHKLNNSYVEGSL